MFYVEFDVLVMVRLDGKKIVTGIFEVPNNDFRLTLPGELNIARKSRWDISLRHHLLLRLSFLIFSLNNIV